VFIASQDDGGWPAKRLVAGTPLYMSPRVHSGRPASPACDLVSLGFAMARMGEHGLPWAHEGFVDTVFGCFFLCFFCFLKNIYFGKKKKKEFKVHIGPPRRVHMPKPLVNLCSNTVIFFRIGWDIFYSANLSHFPARPAKLVFTFRIVAPSDLSLRTQIPAQIFSDFFLRLTVFFISPKCEPVNV
jgi:hypothetical protein